jgi:hypothetical protein
MQVPRNIFLFYLISENLLSATLIPPQNSTSGYPFPIAGNNSFLNTLFNLWQESANVAVEFKSDRNVPSPDRVHKLSKISILNENVPYPSVVNFTTLPKEGYESRIDNDFFILDLLRP